MSWDAKRRGPATGYYYESQRVEGKLHPVKVYRGRGTLGQLAAALVNTRRRERRAASDAVRADAAATAEAERLTNELCDRAGRFAVVWLIATGHHNHRGVWRLKMGGERTEEEVEAWERSLCDNPNYVREIVASLAGRAVAGEPGAAEQLAQVLAEYPEHKSAVSSLGDLTEKAEGMWVRAVGCGDRLASQAARDEAAALTAELLPPGAGLLDRALVGAVVVARLAHAHAAILAAVKTEVPAVQAARDRRLSEAQKRLMSAVKNWQLIAGKKARGLKSSLKVFDAARPAAS